MFFNRDWAGKIVNFPRFQIGSRVYDSCSFKITKKLYEKCSQFFPEEYEEEKLVSDTEGFFECTLLGDKSTCVLMLIYMQ